MHCSKQQGSLIKGEKKQQLACDLIVCIKERIEFGKNQNKTKTKEKENKNKEGKHPTPCKGFGERGKMKNLRKK